ncbi:MAG: phospholipase C type enzyme [Chrysothrix sp. TS-e1954]|nr:MAG: phospholipase C type enzyme [Chrysothrix sp. TS-e1954]
MSTEISPEDPRQLRILTLNCWGLKFIAKHRNARLSQIGVEISNAKPSPEIVGLQECWTQTDYLDIREKTKHILPYGKFYWAGMFGAGLAILSKYPIVQSSVFQYPLNGRPTAFFRGDWFVGKGVACAHIRCGSSPSDIAEVFCTHLHAPYEREPHDSYICHRTAQAWEIAKLMRGAAERGHLVIGLGDFNMIPSSLAHRLITAHAPVDDAWRILHPDSSLGAAENPLEQARRKPMPTVSYNLIENGTTCDSAQNTWRWDKERQKSLDKGKNIEVSNEVSDPRAKRLDYIFIGQGPWLVEDVQVGMTGRHPTLLCSLSDHFSVETTLRHKDRSNFLSEEKASNATLPSALDVTTTSSLPASVYDEILAMIDSYNARERQQRRLRLAHFVGSIVTSIGCLVAVWWSPHNFVSFLLMLLSTFGLLAGVIDGLIGGLFVSSEIRALKEFEWEIRRAQEMAVQVHH